MFNIYCSKARTRKEHVSLGECRICYGDDSEETFISPCKCKGSLAYVHNSCMEEWYSLSDKRKCDLCGTSEFSNIFTLENIHNQLNENFSLLMFCFLTITAILEVSFKSPIIFYSSMKYFLVVHYEKPLTGIKQTNTTIKDNTALVSTYTLILNVFESKRSLFIHYLTTFMESFIYCFLQIWFYILLKMFDITILQE